jgi:hypothetical protein
MVAYSGVGIVAIRGGTALQKRERRGGVFRAARFVTHFGTACRACAAFND